MRAAFLFPFGFLLAACALGDKPDLPSWGDRGGDDGSEISSGDGDNLNSPPGTLGGCSFGGAGGHSDKGQEKAAPASGGGKADGETDSCAQ